MFNLLRNIPLRVKIIFMIGVPMISGLIFAGITLYLLNADMERVKTW